MKKSPLYTRTGDGGTTSLVDGSRAAKCSPRVCAYGSVDELNSFIGLLHAHVCPLSADEGATLTGISNILFNVGCALATPDVTLSGVDIKATDASSCAVPADDTISAAPSGAVGLPPILQGLPDEIHALERAIDRLDGEVEPLRQFILPGGCVAAGHAHVARAVCRRAERDVLSLISTGATVHPLISAFLNRLSDYLFILARYLNRLTSTPELTWNNNTPK